MTPAEKQVREALEVVMEEHGRTILLGHRALVRIPKALTALSSLVDQVRREERAKVAEFVDERERKWKRAADKYSNGDDRARCHNVAHELRHVAEHVRNPPSLHAAGCGSLDGVKCACGGDERAAAFAAAIRSRTKKEPPRPD
ncbi:MAG: hypothetical protein ACK4N5_05345 [Myxococcales bacterium]